MKKFVIKRIVKPLKKFNTKIKTSVNKSNTKIKARHYLNRAKKTGTISQERLDTVRKAYKTGVTGEGIQSGDLRSTRKLDNAYSNQVAIDNKAALNERAKKAAQRGDYKELRDIRETLDPSLRDARLFKQSTKEFFMKHSGNFAKSAATIAIGAPIAASVMQNEKEREKNQEELIKEIGAY